MPFQNETFQVRTTFKKPTKGQTAQLFEGVKSVVTLSASATSVNVGSAEFLTGTISPDKAGHVVDLERMGTDGAFHVIQTRLVNSSSTFEFGLRIGSAGMKIFRVRLPGGTMNVGSTSPPITITATQPPLSSLPTG